MAGREPVWLPEIPCLWLQISPCRCNSIHSWPKDNASLTALALLVQMDFRENKFTPDWGNFSVFHCGKSENFSFLHPCFWVKESLCRGCWFLLVMKMCLRVNFCALLAVLYWSILHRRDTSPLKSSKEQVCLVPRATLEEQLIHFRNLSRVIIIITIQEGKTLYKTWALLSLCEELKKAIAPNLISQRFVLFLSWAARLMQCHWNFRSIEVVAGELHGAVLKTRSIPWAAWGREEVLSS